MSVTVVIDGVIQNSSPAEASPVSKLQKINPTFDCLGQEPNYKQVVMEDNYFLYKETGETVTRLTVVLTRGRPVYVHFNADSRVYSRSYDKITTTSFQSFEDLDPRFPIKLYYEVYWDEMEAAGGIAEHQLTLSPSNYKAFERYASRLSLPLDKVFTTISLVVKPLYSGEGTYSQAEFSSL